MSYYLDIINQTFLAIGKVPFSSLSAPYVSYRKKAGGEVAQYEMREVFLDYGAETEPQRAFLEMLEKSECPLVKAYIESVKAAFVAQNLEELEMWEEA